jgi:hypothetical protein
MNDIFKKLLSDRIVKQSSIISAVLLFTTLLYVIIVYRFLPPFIPIFNQLPWGMERLGERVTIFLPVVIAMCLYGINIIFSQIMYTKMPLVVRMISITTFFISFIICVFIIRTTLLIL